MTAGRLGICRVGVLADNPQGDVIRRLNQKPPRAVKYDYLVVSENVEDASWADAITVKDLRRVKEKLKKKARPGVGLEMAIAPARKMDSACAARWLVDVSELYSFCQSTRCQFILSSGADSPQSMVSGRCLDAILEICGIDPQKHWDSMSLWLASRLGRRVRA
jgi:hypothetical protein